MGRRADLFAGAVLIAVLCLCLGCVANDASREATFAGESVIAPESGEYTARVGLPFQLRAEQDADVIDVTLGGDDVSAMSCWLYKSPAELGATVFETPVGELSAPLDSVVPPLAGLSSRKTSLENSPSSIL